MPSSVRRTSSQRSAPLMARNNSRGSTSQRTGNLPFTSKGTTPPPLNSQQDNPAMTAWTSQEQPYSEYTFQHQPLQLQRSTSQRKSELQQVPEMEDVGNFLNRSRNAVSIPSPSTLAPSTPYPNHRYSASYNPQISLTPSDSLTTATTRTSMSRSNSLCNDNVLEGIQMMRFSSNTSIATDDPLYNDQNTPFTSSLHSRRSSTEEQSLLLTGAGGASHVSQFSPSFPVASSAFLGEKMEKSQSNESTSSSSSSSSSRSLKRLQEQISTVVARPLMPKGYSEETLMSRGNSSHSMSRLGSKDGSDKVAISTKPAYSRPKHDRVQCKDCDGHPEGFRGEHELRRHQDREHKQMVKKFICVEPNDGLQHLKPILPLAKCKACNQQKKKYNAYYNAAAHLRRAHFKPKPSKGRGKQSRLDGDAKRGGKGGGDWPEMKELKCWMREVEEVATEYLTTDEQNAADADDDEESNDPDNDYYPQPTTLSSNNFDSGYLPDAPALPNTSMPNIHLNLDNTNIYDLQITFDLSGAHVDSSMFDGTANSFPYQSDPLLGLYQDPSSIAFLQSSSFVSPQDFSQFSHPGSFMQ